MLMEKMDYFINGYCDLPEELTTIIETLPGELPCTFHSTTGICRFGLKCNRNHIHPSVSKVLLLPNFFTHYQLENATPNEHGNDPSLEFDDSEIYEAFRMFFIDISMEFEKFGVVKIIRVCNNLLPHLRGNVYVEYNELR